MPLDKDKQEETPKEEHPVNVAISESLSKDAEASSKKSDVVDYEKVIREYAVPWTFRDIMRNGLYSARTNLRITAIGTGTDKTATITADYLSVEGLGFKDVSMTIDLGGTGAGKLDTGAIGNSQWYAVWAICDGRGSSLSSMAHVFTTEATMTTRPAPLPGGYTLARRIGVVFSHTDASRLVPLNSKGDFVWLYGSPATDHPGALLRFPETGASGPGGRATGGGTAFSAAIVFWDPV